MVEEIELAYVAGLLDGEGSVAIYTNGRPRNRSISPPWLLDVSIGNTSLPLMDWLKETFGGSIQPHKASLGNKPMYYWVLHSRAAHAFLIEVMPYMRIKYLQAEVALRYYREGQHSTGHKVSDEEFARRSNVSEQLKLLKR